MKPVAVVSDGAPAPVGPYSQAMRSGSLVFCSGQIGIDPKSEELVKGGIRAEARRVMENLKAVLNEAGAGLDRVVKVEVFLADMNDWPTFNEVYSGYFGADTKPARYAVGGARLPKDARVEVACIASLD